MQRAIKLGAKIFGVNHRNLHDLSIDLDRSGRLAQLIPNDAVLISESGVRDTETVRQLGAHSNGFLVGSQLTSQPNIDVAARELVYGPNKVCGLTSPSAAQAARAAGAVYGGLIFEEASPRNVSRETSQEIIASEPNLRYVAVSRRTSGYQELLVDGISAVQIHAPLQGGVEAEKALVAAVRAEVGDTVEVWRAVSMSQELGAEVAVALAGDVDKLVLDAHDGGSGEVFDWESVPAEVKAKSLLAGGLNPDNITEALAVGCLGLDINSGVEYPAEAGKWAGAKDTGALLKTFATISTFHY